MGIVTAFREKQYDIALFLQETLQRVAKRGLLGGPYRQRTVAQHRAFLAVSSGNVR